jgi:hypothetical protein
MSLVTLGEVINESKSSSVLGISDRAKIITYIKRALDLGTFKSNYNPWIGKLDTCSDACGYVTLPYFVETVLACNVGGLPAFFRDKWFEFNVNGPGSNSWGSFPSIANSTGYGNGTSLYGGGSIGVGNTWDDRQFTSTFQDITTPSALLCICEDPADGAGNLQLSVQGITVSKEGYEEEALTTVGPNAPATAVFVPLAYSPNGLATSDPKATLFRRIIQVVKPVTVGYVRLYAVSPQQGAPLTLLGVYGPAETKPQYRRIRVSSGCNWVRVMYRIKTPDLLYDYDVIPIQSLDAMLGLIKAVRFNETNNYAEGKAALDIAVQTLNEIQTIQDGPCTINLQIDPGWGAVQSDLR